MTGWLYRASKWAIAGVVKVLWFLRVEGRQHIPDSGPTLLVSNHASFLDPGLVGCRLSRPCRFMARSTLAKIPILRGWMQGVGVVLVDRKAPSVATMRQIIELLAHGQMVAVFPEGTRTKTGELGPFRPGLLVLAKKTGAVVVPAGIRGSFAVFPPGRRLPRLFRRCSVTYGAPMTAEEVLAAGGLEVLRHRVAQLSGQTLAAATGEETRSTDRVSSSAGAPPGEVPASAADRERSGA